MNRMQGQEDVGFDNELTPEQIKQILAVSKKNPTQMRYDQDVQSALSNMPMYNEQDSLINRLNPQKVYDKQVEDALSKMPSATPTPSPFAPSQNSSGMTKDPGFYIPDEKNTFKPEMDQGFSIPSTFSPNMDRGFRNPGQENINPDDMEMLNKILMQQQGQQMPSATPTPAASPFRNIRGTIDRSK